MQSTAGTAVAHGFAPARDLDLGDIQHEQNVYHADPVYPVDPVRSQPCFFIYVVTIK